MRNIIVTVSSCDKAFFQQLEVFLSSIKKNTSENVCVGLINGSEEHIKKVMNIMPTSDIVLIEINNPTRFDFAKARFEIIRKKLECNYRVCWLDCDIIVRKPLDNFWDGIEPRTMKLVVREGKKDRIKFQIGVVGFGNSYIIKSYIADVRDKLVNKTKWCSDQTEAYRVWKNYKRLINIEKLGIEYNDSEFDNDSVIWHCKSSHFNEEKYQREFKKYL